MEMSAVSSNDSSVVAPSVAQQDENMAILRGIVHERLAVFFDRSGVSVRYEQEVQRLEALLKSAETTLASHPCNENLRLCDAIKTQLKMIEFLKEDGWVEYPFPQCKTIEFFKGDTEVEYHFSDPKVDCPLAEGYAYPLLHAASVVVVLDPDPLPPQGNGFIRCLRGGFKFLARISPTQDTWPRYDLRLNGEPRDILPLLFPPLS